MMKTHISVLILLCILLVGCANTNNSTEQPAKPMQVETSLEATEAHVVIRPLPDSTMEAIENAIVHISFEQNSIYRDESGIILLRMQIYSYDKYDMVDISGLKAGDRILYCGDEIPVNTVERNEHGTVLVNGGLENGGFDLATDDSGIYFVHGYSDMKSWYLVGEAELPVSDGFLFTDGVELEQEELTYSAEDLLGGIPAPEYGYQPQNTTVRIDNGQVVAMERVYTP